MLSSIAHKVLSGGQDGMIFLSQYLPPFGAEPLNASQSKYSLARGERENFTLVPWAVLQASSAKHTLLVVRQAIDNPIILFRSDFWKVARKRIQTGSPLWCTREGFLFVKAAAFSAPQQRLQYLLQGQRQCLPAHQIVPA